MPMLCEDGDGERLVFINKFLDDFPNQEQFKALRSLRSEVCYQAHCYQNISLCMLSPFSHTLAELTREFLQNR